MDIVQAFLPHWMIAKIIWTYHHVMPLMGIVLTLLILVNGLRWFFRALRRAGRAVMRTANDWISRWRAARQAAFEPSQFDSGDALGLERFLTAAQKKQPK